MLRGEDGCPAGSVENGKHSECTGLSSRMVCSSAAGSYPRALPCPCGDRAATQDFDCTGPHQLDEDGQPKEARALLVSAGLKRRQFGRFRGEPSGRGVAPRHTSMPAQWTSRSNATRQVRRLRPGLATSRYPPTPHSLTTRAQAHAGAVLPWICSLATPRDGRSGATTARSMSATG